MKYRNILPDVSKPRRRLTLADVGTALSLVGFAAAGLGFWGVAQRWQHFVESEAVIARQQETIHKLEADIVDLKDALAKSQADAHLYKEFWKMVPKGVKR